MYYETHITMNGNPDVIEKRLEGTGWKFSKIDGDINLGLGIKCYATKQFNVKYGFPVVLNKLNSLAYDLHKEGFDVLRQKIELVLYDNKQKRDTQNES